MMRNLAVTFANNSIARSTSASGGIAADTPKCRALGQVGVAADGAEGGGHAHRPGRASRPGGDGDAPQVEHQRLAFALDTSGAEAELVRQPSVARLGAVQVNALDGLANALEQPHLQLGRLRGAFGQARRRRVPRSTPAPAIAATFSVPARNSFSCTPPWMRFLHSRAPFFCKARPRLSARRIGAAPRPANQRRVAARPSPASRRWRWHRRTTGCRVRR